MTRNSPALPWLMALTGTLLLAREAVFYIGFAILGSSINWPASLGLPAEEIFILLRDESVAMFAGYYVYLISSAMFVPVAVCLRALIAGEVQLTTLMADIALAFAILSAAFRVVGILRWLFAMPLLSQTYFDPESSQALRDATLMTYEVLNAFAGQIGEHLGVRLFATLFVGFFAIAFFRSSRVPTLFAVWAAVSALLFFPLEELIGVDGGPILFINGFTFSFWAIFFGGYLLVTASRRAGISLANGARYDQ
ncbi:MAG: DUF4386 family protein [Pseudomonadota bacterium]